MNDPASIEHTSVRIDPEAPPGVREIPNGLALTEHSSDGERRPDTKCRGINGSFWPAAAFSQ